MAFELAKRAALPAQSTPKPSCCKSAGRCLACATLLSSLTTPWPGTASSLTVFRTASLAPPSHLTLGSVRGRPLLPCQVLCGRQVLVGSPYVSMLSVDHNITCGHAVHQCQGGLPGQLLGPQTHQPASRAAGGQPLAAASARGEEETPVPGTLKPKFVVSVLPVEQGGLGLLDLAAHSTAMLAKEGWLLLRHSSHPWQDLVHRATVALFPPALGRPPFYCPAATLPHRLRPMTQAFRRFNVCRIMAPASQDHRSVLAKLTFHNTPDLATHPAADPEPAARAWRRLWDVRVVYLGRAVVAGPASCQAAQALASRCYVRPARFSCLARAHSGKLAASRP